MSKKKTEVSAEQPKQCMFYLKSIRTTSYEIKSGARAKLSQDEIDAMHDEIKEVYPNQGQWIAKVAKKDCHCKK